MSQYNFPVLEVHDVREYLNESYENFDIQEKDFTQPDGKKWQRWFLVMLCDSCIGMTPDSVNQIPMTSQLSFPEIHEESIPLFNLMKCMQALLTSCGFCDFKITDLTGPRQKRLIRMCSAFINFRRFQDERLNTVKELQDQNDALQDQREALLRDNDEMKQRINQVKGLQAEKDVEVRAIQEHIAEWTEKIESLHHAVATKQKESSESKLRIAELKSDIARSKEQIVQTKQENSRLTAKIVPSPDRLKGEMERMERQLMQAKHTKQDFQQREVECRNRYQLQEQHNVECDQMLRFAEAVKEQKDKQRAVLTQINNMQEETGTNRREMKQLDAKAQQLTMQIRTKLEKLETMTMQHNMKINDRRATIEQLEKELLNAQQVCGAQNSQSQRLRAEIQTLKEAQQDELNSHQETMDLLRGKYLDMLKGLEAYHEKIGEGYQKMESKLKRSNNEWD